MTEEKNLTIVQKITDIGLPLTDAEKIVASFSEISERMLELDKELIEFNKINPEEITEAVCKKAKVLRLKHVKIRTRGDEIHSNLKSDVLLRTRAIDGVRNIYKLKLSEREDKLQKIEKHFEMIKKAKQDKIFEDRANELSKYVEDISVYNLREMSNDGYNEILKNSKIIYDQKLKEEKEEKERAEAKAKAVELYNKRKEELIPYWQFLKEDQISADFGELPQESFDIILREVKQAKVEYDKKQADIQAENARLKKIEDDRKKSEQEAKEAKDKYFEEKKGILIGMGFKYSEDSFGFVLDNIWSSYYEKVYNLDKKGFDELLVDIKNAISKHEQLLKEKADKAKLQKEIDDKRKADEEAQEKARLEADKQTRIDAELKKQAELAPDKEKLISYADALNEVKLPALNSEEAKVILQEAQELLSKVIIKLKIK